MEKQTSCISDLQSTVRYHIAAKSGRRLKAAPGNGKGQETKTGQAKPSSE
jgi:hypothetical protein